MPNETWLKRNLVAIVGFAIQLLVLGVYIGRQEQIISSLEKRTSALEERVTSHHEDRDAHTTAEWRGQVLQRLDRIDGKIDAHIMADTDKKNR
jgi:hypothetical protein